MPSLKTKNTKKHKKLLKGSGSKTKRHIKENNNESFNSEITIIKDNSNTSSEFIPKYKIINSPGFSVLELNLNDKQSVIASQSAMAYMDSHIKLTVEATSGFFSSVKRALLTSSSLFLSKYTGTSTKHNKVAFSAPNLPEDIVPILVKAGDSIMISPNTLLCYTSNLEIYTKRRLRGLFVGEGGFQSNIINNSDKNGIVWLSSYGGYYKLEIEEGDKIKVDDGLFLCSSRSVKYSISKAGSLFGAIVSKEGLVMEFEGPATIYCQGRSLSKFIKFIMAHSAKK